MSTLTHKGVSMVLSDFQNTDLIKLKKKLTIRLIKIVPGRKSYIQEVRNYLQEGRYIYIPRFKAIQFELQFENKLIIKSQEIPYKYVGKLFDFQQPIVDRLMDIFSPINVAAGKAGCVIKAETGIGKTFIAANIISLKKCRTLFIVPQINLALQTYNTFSELFPEEQIGLYYSGRKNIQNITIGISKSCIKDKYNATNKSIANPNPTVLTEREFFSNFDMIIFDEIHSYTGISYRKIFNISQRPMMLGMSASMSRDRVELYDYVVDRIGPIFDVDELPSIKENKVVFVGQATITRPVLVNDIVSYMGTAKLISKDHRRNCILIDEALKLPDRKILILTIFRSHVIELFRLLSEKLTEKNNSDNNLNKVERKVYVPEINIKILMKKIHNKFKKIQITSSKLTEENISLESLTALKNQYESTLDLLKKTNSIIRNSVNNISFIMGGSSIEEVNSSIKTQIIISTNKYSGTGMSVDDATVLIGGLPIKKESMQVSGRITRTNPKYNHIFRHYIDICDERSTLKSQLNERIKQYKKKNMSIVYVDS